jgi:hypothetical protein
VRPVNRRRDAGINGFNRRKQIPGVDVFGAEDLAPVEVIELEVICQCPVGSVAAQRCLPHVAMGIDHARHQDAASRVDLDSIIGHGEMLTNLRDAVISDENIAAGDDAARWVNGQDSGVAEHHGTVTGEVFDGWCAWLAHAGHLRWCLSALHIQF